MTTISPTPMSLVEPRIAATAVTTTSMLMLAWSVIVAWPLAAAMRFVGRLVGVGALSNAAPADFALVGLVLVGFLIAFPIARKGKLFWASVAGWGVLLAIVSAHLVGAPEVASAWNTRVHELTRGLALAAIWCLFHLLWKNRATVEAQVFALRVLWVSGMICGVFAVLQSLDALPNFYFQWYGPSRVGRPTGGFTHPHFYTATCIIAACAAWGLARTGRMGMAMMAGSILFMLVCVIASTSRVGMIFSGLVVLFALFRASVARPGLFALPLVFGALATAALIIWLARDGAPEFIKGPIDMFASAFARSDGDFLRGRGSRWEHEWSLITSSPTRFFFGYGYQPFVSHNLVLRQLQATGVVGTGIYLSLMVAVLLRSLGAGWLREGRTIVLCAWIPVLVGAITFPVLVSVVLNAALALLFLALRPPVQSNSIATARREQKSDNPKLAANSGGSSTGRDSSSKRAL